MPSEHERERIVDPAKVPAALSHTGLRIEYRSGATPYGFNKAIYGVATDTHGIGVSFGLLFVDDTRAATHYNPSLLALVPGAREQNVTEGISFIELTSAGTAKTPRSKSIKLEEAKIARRLLSAVAPLSRKALEEEGP